jgi:formylglycine-generating enzyme required for sulfatase activity
MAAPHFGTPPGADGLKGALPLHDPAGIRRAGRDLLSLALLDSRNQLLHALSAWPTAAPPAARRLALRAGWYQEHWISRHVQRSRAEACDPAGPRLAGVEPRIVLWLAPPGDVPDAQLPDGDTVRGYLAQTLDITLDLLAATPDADAPLHFFRQALLHEDRLTEALAALLQRGAPPPRPQRAPLWLPAQRWQLGSPRPEDGGSAWTPRNERWAHAVAIPETEIDAQAVNWLQFAEFAADGGYDRPDLWTEAGRAWLQAEGTGRAPRHVEQLGSAVLVRRGSAGVLRAAPTQPAMHLTRFEAEAWCQWAGRRLPTEPEWELAAATASSRGFVWGDVFEWVAGSARTWPGAGDSAPGCLDPLPAAGTHGVLRGASFATPLRRKHPKARRFAPLAHDGALSGFRSCAV